MKMMIAKAVFWTSLLLVLLGEGSIRLMAQGGGIPPAPQCPFSVVS
jgi:hypothetical protein